LSSSSSIFFFFWDEELGWMDDGTNGWMENFTMSFNISGSDLAPGSLHTTMVGITIDNISMLVVTQAHTFLVNFSKNAADSVWFNIPSSFLSKVCDKPTKGFQFIISTCPPL
jgi:hypothetical protein